MAYDKKTFLSGLAMGLCGKGNPTFEGSDVFSKGYSVGAKLRAKRVLLEGYVGKHFRSFWDMSQWTVHIMAYREASNPASNYLYEYTMETLPNTLTIPYSLIRNLGGNDTHYYYPLQIVIETPHTLTDVSFAKYAITFPNLSESATQYNPWLYMKHGAIKESSAVAGKHYFSGVNIGTTLDLSVNNSIITSIFTGETYPNDNYGDGCEFQFDTLKVIAKNGYFTNEGANCLCAEISIGNDDHTAISGSFTLDFTNFFIDLV